MKEEKLLELERIIDEFKTIDVKEKPNGVHFLKFKAYDFNLNNGKTITREELIKGNSNGNAVIIVPILKNGNFLTVIEPRVFTDIGVGVSFPAGYIDKDEKPEDAALRELSEETGYVPETIEYLDSFYQDEGCSKAMNYIYIAKGCEKKVDQHLDEDEFIKYMEFSFEELLDLENFEYIKGGNTKLALNKLKNILK